MDDVDVFYHIGEIRSTSMTDCAKNISLMEKILSSPAVKKIRRLVFVSSITVAGIPGEVPATEGTASEISLNDQYTFISEAVRDYWPTIPRAQNTQS